jgi:hypothetical protein
LFGLKQRCQIGFGLLLVGGWSAIAAPVERSLSPTKQFVIYGSDSISRSAVSDLAERTKKDLLAVLNQRDDWKTPIVVNLQSVQANVPELPPAALHFSQTGFGLKIQLDLTLGPKWDTAQLERELLRAVLLEFSYRKQSDLAVGISYVSAPDWLVDGLLSSAPGRDRASLIEALIANDRPISLEDFLRLNPDQLDSPARALYQGYSFALVQLLLRGENGRALADFVENLSSATSDPRADLQHQFPELIGRDGETLWSSQIARVKVEYDQQLLSFAETERRLEELVPQKTSDRADSAPVLLLRDLATRKTSPEERSSLLRLRFDLLLLATRANPILRSTVQEYQQIAGTLAGGRNKGVIARLGRIETLRAKIAARMSDVDDYMNWFEATKLKTNSGEFADYVTAAKEQEQIRPHRRDPLSIYLDALEEQF